MKTEKIIKVLDYIVRIANLVGTAAAWLLRIPRQSQRKDNMPNGQPKG